MDKATGEVMPLSYRQNIPPVGLPHKDYTRPIKMAEDLELPQPRTSCAFGINWSDDEIKRLRRMYKENYPIEEIALTFSERSFLAVKAKIYMLGWRRRRRGRA